MLPLARNGYTAAQVDAAFHAPTRQIQFRYDLLDSTNAFKKTLTTVTDGSIAYDTTQQIKRTAQFTLQDDGNINFLSDRIQPFALLKMPPVYSLTTTNVTLGKPYTKNIAPSPTYPDTGSTKFTDGSTTESLANGFGYNGTMLGVGGGGYATVDITVDLGYGQLVGKFVLFSGGGASGYMASDLNIYVSNDGNIFSLVASSNAISGDEITAIPTNPVSVRYIRFQAEKVF